MRRPLRWRFFSGLAVAAAADGELEPALAGEGDDARDVNRADDPGLAANHLIDLYRASGNRGRLMAELARFAASHAESDAGRAARKELQSLKEADVRLDASRSDP